MKTKLLIPLAVAVLFGVVSSSHAQTLLDENFNSMGIAGTTPPTGWTIGFLGDVGTVNRVVISPYAGNGLRITSMPLVVNDGSALPALNVGTALNLGTTGSSDRALGNYPRTNPSGDQIMQVAVRNNTGSALSSIGLSYAGEQWRQSQGTSTSGPETVFLLVSTTSPTNGFQSLGSAFDFTAPLQGPGDIGLDGNAAANRKVISGTLLLPTSVPNNGTFYVRWHDWNDNATTDHFLGIDDVKIQAVPEPGVLSLLLLGAAGLIARRRK